WLVFSFDVHVLKDVQSLLVDSFINDNIGVLLVRITEGKQYTDSFHFPRFMDGLCEKHPLPFQETEVFKTMGNGRE
ncbi:hypothetical protein HMI55_002730, partial [Coelomomyces lativittatus]